MVYYGDEVIRARAARREGRVEGRTEAICDIARNMKAQGLPLELIARTTGLSPGEVDKL